MQKTKIIATIGPSSENITTLKKMIQAGMDVARLNLSHGTLDYHGKLINNIRKASNDLNRPVPIIFDLQGPKIRTGKITKSGFSIKKNDRIILVPEDLNVPIKTAYLYVPIQFEDLYKYLKKGQTIYIDDATIELKVININKKTIDCQVQNNGIIKSHKGINVPGANIDCPSLNKKDLADLEFGIRHRVEYIALSYVNSAKDIVDLRKKIISLEKKYGYVSTDYGKPKEKGKWSGIHSRIIAKIERPGAVKNFDKILEASDAIMIARGDLGMEMPLEDLPLVQKEIVEKCLEETKPVIVATQMLESMTTKPVPTRAEVSDVANAILDGTDAIMLSGESATGSYPTKAVKIMDRIAHEVEPAEVNKREEIIVNKEKRRSITRATAISCKLLADKINARAIICTTTSGFTARTIAALKPKQPIIALSPSEVTQKQLNLSWSVFPYFFKRIHSFDLLIKNMKTFLLKEKIVKKGETVIICTGHPLGYAGQTSLIKIETL